MKDGWAGDALGSRLRWSALALGAALGAATWTGCAMSDEDALLRGPQNPIAAQSFASLWLVDGCRGGGKLSFCSTETVEEVLELAIDDPSVLRFAEAEEVPKGLPSDMTHPVVQGLAAGSANVRVRARFSDAERAAEVNVEVVEVDAVALPPACAEAEAPLRVLPGKTLTFNVVPHGGGKPLDGVLPGLVRGEGVTCSGIDYPSRMHCSWTAPLEGGAVELVSDVLPGFRGRLQSYGANDVVAVHAFTERIWESAVGPGWPVRLPTATALKEGIPCESLPVRAVTATPSICTGPDGELAWDASDDDELLVEMLQTGTCKLQLGAAGAATLPSTAEFFMRVVSQATVDHLADPETACEVEGATTCKSFHSTMRCENGRWRDLKSCGSGVCELVGRGEAGCTSAEGCAVCRP
ncbi:hypothetical protein BE04_42385 [Sorangium cellulosum]|uniref:Uncharacterized protein n=3 Tax=Sorangium cellulosum TaxID=56 RepID=A0A150PBC8_SORCE|nr:hypothetical protein SCE1572_07240 [Sorangium cellulosum So0157-2]KYF52977.1 hypothetical protein BE04_42385 [Sorangium cellulosum]